MRKSAVSMRSGAGMPSHVARERHGGQRGEEMQTGEKQGTV